MYRNRAWTPLKSGVTAYQNEGGNVCQKHLNSVNSRWLTPVPQSQLGQRRSIKCLSSSLEFALAKGPKCLRRPLINIPWSRQHLCHQGIAATASQAPESTSMWSVQFVAPGLLSSRWVHFYCLTQTAYFLVDQGSETRGWGLSGVVRELRKREMIFVDI